MSQKSGKGDALRKEKALLHTFVAGQKSGVGRDATRRFCFEGLKKNNKGNRLSICCPKMQRNPASRARSVNNRKRPDRAHFFGELSLLQLILDPDQQGFLLNHIQLVNFI